MTYKNDVTRRDTLLECLEIFRWQWKIASKNYNCLEPKEGMEEQFDKCMKKTGVIEGLIQALESENVRAAIAEFTQEGLAPAQWQQETMAGNKQTGLFAPEAGRDYRMIPPEA